MAMGNAMGTNEFEQKVLEGIAELRTNMRRLVGEDGNGGIVRDHGRRIDHLERERDTAKGKDQGKLALMVGLASAVLTQAANTAFNYFIHR